jgi:DNA repair exonuclease SbcCD nuclease subunit
MARFLHTADWHLGMKYAKLGLNAEKAREVRIQTANAIIEYAQKHNVDFIIIAGDLFDNNDIGRDLIDAVIRILQKAAPIPVYILPGNHDPLTIDSIYANSSWKTLSNTYIIDQPKPLFVPNIPVTLYPCPVTQKQTKKDLSEWIQATDNQISIGIAHGNLQIPGFTDDPNFPIDPERAEKSGLDYLSLGEWHSLFPFKGKDGAIRTLYPGTPEPTKSGENNCGRMVIVEIEEHGSKPILQEVEIGTLQWEERLIEVSSLEEIKRLEKELKDITDSENWVLDLILKGIIDQEAFNYLEAMENQCVKNFLYFKINRNKLHINPDLTKLKNLIPEGVLFGKVINAIEALKIRHPSLQEFSILTAEDAEIVLQELTNASLPLNPSPKALERALMILYQIGREVAR